MLQPLAKPNKKYKMSRQPAVNIAIPELFSRCALTFALIDPSPYVYNDYNNRLKRSFAEQQLIYAIIRRLAVFL
jgi:hypothetical protein